MIRDLIDRVVLHAATLVEDVAQQVQTRIIERRSRP